MRATLVWLGLIVLTLGVVGVIKVAPRRACDSSAVKAAYLFSREWRDARRLAGATSRIAISGPLSELQRLRREQDQLPKSQCLTREHAERARELDAAVEEFLAFSSGSNFVDISAERAAGVRADAELLAARRRVFPDEVAAENVALELERQREMEEVTRLKREEEERAAKARAEEFAAKVKADAEERVRAEAEAAAAAELLRKQAADHERQRIADEEAFERQRQNNEKRMQLHRQLVAKISDWLPTYQAEMTEVNTALLNLKGAGRDYRALIKPCAAFHASLRSINGMLKVPEGGPSISSLVIALRDLDHACLSKSTQIPSLVTEALLAQDNFANSLRAKGVAF